MPSVVSSGLRRLDELTPYPQNPRHITDGELARLASSLIEDETYFHTRPILCSNRTGQLVIVAGEKRWLAAKSLGWREAPVAVIEGLTEQDERRILVKDNGSFGWWDWQEFKEWGYEALPVADWGVLVPFDALPSLTDGPDYTLVEPQTHMEQKPNVQVKCPACGFNFEPKLVKGMKLEADHVDEGQAG